MASDALLAGITALIVAIVIVALILYLNNGVIVKYQPISRTSTIQPPQPTGTSSGLVTIPASPNNKTNVTNAYP
jgi:hypothetical protein